LPAKQLFIPTWLKQQNISPSHKMIQQLTTTSPKMQSHTNGIEASSSKLVSLGSALSRRQVSGMRCNQSAQVGNRRLTL